MVKKLSLNADHLRVLSFTTAEVRQEGGTVHGCAHTHGLTCSKPCSPTLNPLPTSPCVCIERGELPDAGPAR